MITHVTLQSPGAEARGSLYAASGRRTLHAVIQPVGSAPVGRQLSAIDDCARSLLRDYPGMQPTLRRYYLDDVVNNAPAGGHDAWVAGQPPCRPGARAAMLLMAEEGVEVSAMADGIAVKRGPYTDLLTRFAAPSGLLSGEATHQAFTALEATLWRNGASVAEGCVRTWFYVRDIDATYFGMVRARNAYFDSIGLTRHTHFIASTGIGAAQASPLSALTMEALSTVGLAPGQVTYINSPAHLNPTAEYGVAFERAAAVDYGDRRLTLVSGTASIDNSGRILHEGDVVAQWERVLSNVRALLGEAGAWDEDVMHAVVYVRSMADAALVMRRLPSWPCLVVQGPVCRPGWLVEMECLAMTPHTAPYHPY